MNQTIRSACRPFASACGSARRAPTTHRLTVNLQSLRTIAPRAAPPESATDTPKSTGELAKEALLQTINSDATTAKDVLGEGTLAQLKHALGEERAGQFIGALDGLLANRRLATVLFAVADVVLIWVAIKVFRSTVMHE